MCPGMAIERKHVSEAAWNRWLLSRPPWELHFLTHGELELVWHDYYVSGMVTLDDLTARLYDEFAPSDADASKKV